MLQVFEPLNSRIERLILENGDLFEGSRFPEIFVDALAHIAAYRALYPKWGKGDFSVHTSLIDFPPKLLDTIEPTYRNLLAKQRELSGHA